VKLLLLLGLLLTQPVWAGWTDIGESDTVTLYVDLASINKTASGRSALSLFDYKVLKKDSNSEWLSAVVLNEYDCTKNSMRSLRDISYSGRMGTGKVVFDDKPTIARWEVQAPQTVGEVQLRAICSAPIRKLRH
jgi:hypothetical protein